MTLRKALALLEEEKLIARRHGSGTCIVRKSNYHGGELEGFNYQMQVVGVTNYRNKVIEFTLLDAPPAIAQQLKIQPGEKVYYVRRLRLIDEVPIPGGKQLYPLRHLPPGSAWVTSSSLSSTISKKSAISPSSRATAAIPRCWRPVSRRSCCRWRQTASCCGCSRSATPRTGRSSISQRSTRTPVSTM